MIGLTKRRVTIDESEGIDARDVEQSGVRENVSDLELRDAALPGAEEISRTPELEIDFSDLEAVRRRCHRREPSLGQTLLVKRQTI